MKIVSPLNDDNKQGLIKSENICKEFYKLLDEDNKLNQGDIDNFQECDFYKEIKEGNDIKINDIVGKNINISNKKEIKEEIKENKIEKEDKNEIQKEGEEDEEDGEEGEEVEEEENKE